MNSQAHEIREFLSRMSILYGPPETPDPKRFIREYEVVLANYAAHLIPMAANHIRDTHTRRSWPTPAEVKAALREVAPSPPPIDWDAVEADRKEGWKFSDLNRVKVDDAAKARVQAMVDEMKRNLAANYVETKDSIEPDWKRAQRPGFEEMQRRSRGLSHVSKRMTGERD